MALKIGKREKIIVGLIIGIVAIGAAHFFVFQKPAQKLDSLRMQAENAVIQFNSVAPVAPRDKINEFRQQTVEDEKAFWQAILQMEIVPNPVFAERPPKPPMPPDAPQKPRVMAYWEGLVAEWQRVEDAYQTAVEEIIIARLNRLREMKQAYEAGETWAGDSSELTSQMKMSFLEDKREGWRLPTQLPAPLRDRPTLWDAVDRLYSTWDVFTLYQRSGQTDATLRAQSSYVQNLQNLGINIYQLQEIGQITGKFLPEIIKLVYARLVWDQKEPDQTIRVGVDRELSPGLLRNMFDVNLPRYFNLRPLNDQLVMLENLLPLARKNGVQEISVVRLYESQPLMEAVRMQAQPMAPVGGFRQGGSAGAATINYLKKGELAVLGIRFIGPNQSAFRFLYEIVTHPAQYRIDSLGVYSLPGTDNVQVEVAVNHVFFIQGLGLDSNLFHPVTGAGQPISENPQIAEWLQQQMQARAENNELNERAIVQEVFARLNYTPALTPTP